MGEEDEMSEYVGISQAAALLGVSRNTVGR
jgi:hypothetical protein